MTNGALGQKHFDYWYVRNAMIILFSPTASGASNVINALKYIYPI